MNTSPVGPSHVVYLNNGIAVNVFGAVEVTWSQISDTIQFRNGQSIVAEFRSDSIAGYKKEQ